RVVLFGGKAAEELGDTWEWDGTSWTQRTGSGGPRARFGHAMVYDAARGKTLLIGGTGDDLDAGRGDPWQWDGSAWSPLTPARAPSPRSRLAIAYDAVRERVVLFGGFSASGEYLGDTWEWDGTSWTQLTPSTGPPPRFDHTLVYDPVRRV